MQGVAKLDPGSGHVDIIELETPTPTANEVLIEVDYAGLCGSDAGIYRYKSAFERMKFPTIIGHEYTGRIVELGENVSNFSKGDRVVERPIRNCGHCYQCSIGLPNLCQNSKLTGIDHHGAFAGYVTAPESTLQGVPAGTGAKEAALAEPAAVSVRAVIENSRVHPGDKVLVAGPGPIGLLTAQVAQAQGGDVLVAGIDNDSNYRLPLAENLGLSTINIEKVDIQREQEKLTNKIGFDVAFDVTGHPSGLKMCVDEVRKGGQIVLVGQIGEMTMSYTPLLRGEIDVQCTYSALYEDFDRAFKLAESGDFDHETLIDERFSLKNIEEVFEAFLAGDTCKPVFDVSVLR